MKALVVSGAGILDAEPGKGLGKTRAPFPKRNSRRRNRRQRCIILVDSGRLALEESGCSKQ